MLLCPECRRNSVWYADKSMCEECYTRIVNASTIVMSGMPQKLIQLKEDITKKHITDFVGHELDGDGEIYEIRSDHAESMTAAWTCMHDGCFVRYSPTLLLEVMHGESDLMPCGHAWNWVQEVIR